MEEPAQTMIPVVARQLQFLPGDQERFHLSFDVLQRIGVAGHFIKVNKMLIKFVEAGLGVLLGEPIIPFEEMLWRFGMASFFGMLLGLDREMRGISAGVRTHMLVALSSAMTMLIALELFEELSIRGESDPDPSRAIQGLAQAIGFLCAGVIFVARGNVYGLTTAASLWMTSTIGMASGAGLYSIAVAGSGFALLIVSVMWMVKRWTPEPKSALPEAESPND